MTYSDGLEIAANWAAIATAALAAFAYSKFRYEKWTRRQKLEAYLRDQRMHRFDEGQRTILHLVAALSMTEAEIFAAAFDSKMVNSQVSSDSQGRADRLYFQYDGDDIPIRRPL